MNQDDVHNRPPHIDTGNKWANALAQVAVYAESKHREDAYEAPMQF